MHEHKIFSVHKQQGNISKRKIHKRLQGRRRETRTSRACLYLRRLRSSRITCCSSTRRTRWPLATQRSSSGSRLTLGRPSGHIMDCSVVRGALAVQKCLLDPAASGDPEHRRRIWRALLRRRATEKTVEPMTSQTRAGRESVLQLKNSTVQNTGRYNDT